MSKEKEAVEFVLKELIGALQILVKLYRRKARYKRYRPAMRSAFANRALGIEKAIKAISSILPEDSSMG